MLYTRVGSECATLAEATKLGLYVKEKKRGSEDLKDFEGWCWPGSQATQEEACGAAEYLPAGHWAQPLLSSLQRALLVAPQPLFEHG